MALPAVVPVEAHGHEDAGSAHLVRTLPPEPDHLVAGVHLVELEHCKFRLFPFVLDLIRLSVRLLFAIIASSSELQRQENFGVVAQTALARDVCRASKSSTIDELLLLAGNTCGLLDPFLQRSHGARRIHLDG